MPTWRKLHVKTLDSVDVAEMPDDFTRLTWLMLPLIVDREGRAIDDANWLRSKLFPLRRDVTLEMIDAVMGWYYQRGMIERYEVGGRSYFAIIKFSLYQGNTEREAASVIPEPVKLTRKSKSRPTHELVTSKSPPDVDAEEIREEIPGAQTAPESSPEPNKPDALKELAAVFEQASGIKIESIQKKSRGALYWNPLEIMIRTADGSAPEILRAAVAQLRQNGMTLSNPGSTLKTFNSIHGTRRTAPPTVFKDYK